ncbi:flavin reductase family protein, partial [Zoogloea sp.]
MPTPNCHSAPFDGRLFRRVLGLFPTGVTIVTTWDADGRPVGATVSSFNTVSLDPPLVLFSLAKNMACCEAFAAGGPLAIHVLGDTQEDLSNRFARGGGDKWADLAYAAGQHGAPLIEGTL